MYSCNRADFCSAISCLLALGLLVLPSTLKAENTSTSSLESLWSMDCHSKTNDVIKSSTW